MSELKTVISNLEIISLFSMARRSYSHFLCIKSSRRYALLFLFCLATVSMNCFGDDSLPPELQKVKRFVESKDACVYAVAEVPSDKKLLVQAFSSAWKERLLCIQDLTLYKGTINEVSGCTLTWFNSDQGIYLPVQTMDSFGRANFVVVNKKCTLGGLEELLGQKLGIYGTSTVLRHLIGVSNSRSSLVVLVSSPKLSSIVEKAKSAEEENKRKAEAKEKNEKSEKQKKALSMKSAEMFYDCEKTYHGDGGQMAQLQVTECYNELISLSCREDQKCISAKEKEEVKVKSRANKASESSCKNKYDEDFNNCWLAEYAKAMKGK